MLKILILNGIIVFVLILVHKVNMYMAKTLWKKKDLAKSITYHLVDALVFVGITLNLLKAIYDITML